MSGTSASATIPFLRSCKQELAEAVDGEVQGEIPKWLKGCLIRVGSGLLEVGSDKYNHLFDGLALMHRFSFQDGKVKYQNRFLRSDTYKRNMKANRIAVNEFGTLATPDPCKTIFHRLTSIFSKREGLTDNDLVNIVFFGGEVYACSETNKIWKIDPNTLESIEKVNLSRHFPITGAIAHAHEDTDGTVYNIGSTFGLHCSYSILKFPPKGEETGSTFQNGTVVCNIPSSKLAKMSYHHSFAMTKNYFVFVEQPLLFSLPRMAWNYFTSSSMSDAMSWEENTPCRFHVVRRKDGQLLDTVYLSKSFFVFHHVNCYEENDQLVIDACCYEDGNIIKLLYIQALEELFNNTQKYSKLFASKAKRYVLPLDISESKPEEKKNLVTLSNSEATAYRQSDGSIFCSPELLTSDNSWAPELPRINYDFNGKKYRYMYAIGQNEASIGLTHLVKIDTVSKTSLSWGEEGVTPSEPVFISQPQLENQDEDSGVLLASLLYRSDESKVSMLVLDAKTMKEIGRTTFAAKASVPGDFHGTFISNK